MHNIKGTVLYDAAFYSLVDVLRSFGRKYCLHLQGALLVPCWLLSYFPTLMMEALRPFEASTWFCWAVRCRVWRMAFFIWEPQIRYGLPSSSSFLQCLCFPLWTSEQQQFPSVFVFSVMDFWAATVSFSVCVFRYGLLSSSSFLQCLCFPLWTSEQQQFPSVFVFSVMDFWAATVSFSVCVFRCGLLSSSSFLQCLCFPLWTSERNSFLQCLCFPLWTS
jgi:hypothetical protein